MKPTDINSVDAEGVITYTATAKLDDLHHAVDVATANLNSLTQQRDWYNDEIDKAQADLVAKQELVNAAAPLKEIAIRDAQIDVVK